MTDKNERLKNLSNLTDVMLDSPSFRKSFRNDPLGAAKHAGIENISLKDMDALESLNENEIEVLRNVKEKLLAKNPEFGRTADGRVSDVIGGVIF